ncbi:MAG: hypothetical protein EPO07_09500, partial [Verrucomicrobia bacterium]
LAAGALLVTAAPAGYDYTISTNTPGQIKLIVTPPPPPPAAPSALAATTISTSQIDLTWLDNSTNESSFLIERSQDNVNFSQVVTTGAGVTSYSDTGLSAGTTYYYRVRAGNAGGNSPYSNVASATTIPSEAVAWYEFEMTPLDSSGNNNHAVPVGTLLYGPGKRGLEAAQFNGTAFAQITRIVGTNFTVAMWLQTTNTGPASGQWYSGLGLVDGEMVGSAADWGCSVINSKFAFGIGNPDTTISTTVNINDGNWHHVAATRVSDTGAVKLYVDGALNVSASAPMGPRTAPNELRIGATHANPPVLYVGSMDDLKLYDRALNASEIAELVRLTFPQWQLDNFGCTDCPQAAADADPDGDGMSNTAEFNAGTSPTNSASVFRITSFGVQTNNASITWKTVGGRTNVVQSVAGDANGSISPAYIDVSGPIVISGNGDTTTNFVDVGAADGVSRYYRIRQLK